MTQIPPVYVRPDRARFLQPDMRVEAIAPEHGFPPEAISKLAAGIAVIRREVAQLRALLAWKANFDPTQPRDERGRWTDTGAGSETSDKAGTDPRPAKDFAADRNRAAREASRNLSQVPVVRRVPAILRLLELGRIARDAALTLIAEQDPPRSLEDLQQAVSRPAIGYDIHHIVERTPAEQAGFPRSLIDGPENLVRIPTMKHWEITSWYATPNDEFGGLSPRNYLRGKDWTVRYQVGKFALIEHGVLKP